MKVKTVQLKGAALDWAVFHSDPIKAEFTPENKRFLLPSFHPSTDWSQGGPLIDKYRIVVGDRSKGFDSNSPASWTADCNGPRRPSVYSYMTGETALEAACRALVNSLIGSDTDGNLSIEIPDELCEVSDG